MAIGLPLELLPIVQTLVIQACPFAHNLPSQLQAVTQVGILKLGLFAMDLLQDGVAGAPLDLVW
jgi:hypothetical protein